MTTTHPMQRTFDEIRRARATDPETSRQAASKAGELAADHRFRILAVLRARPECPMAPHEIAAACSLEPVQVARRIREMADDGDIVEAGPYAVTPSGRRARTWRLP